MAPVSCQMQRSKAVAGLLCGCQLQQALHSRFVPLSCCKVERLAALLVNCYRRRWCCLKQLADAGDMASRCRLMQRGAAAVIRQHGSLRCQLQQALHSRFVALSCCQVQSAAAIVLLSLQRRLWRCRCKLSDAVDIALEGCLTQQG